MSDGNQLPAAGALAEHRRGSGGWDVFSQLQRTSQWEADGTQLLRPVNIHARAAAGRSTTP